MEKRYYLTDFRKACGIDGASVRVICRRLGFECPAKLPARGRFHDENLKPFFTRLEAAAIIREYHRKSGQRALNAANKGSRAKTESRPLQSPSRQPSDAPEAERLSRAGEG